MLTDNHQNSTKFYILVINVLFIADHFDSSYFCCPRISMYPSASPSSNYYLYCAPVQVFSCFSKNGRRLTSVLVAKAQNAGFVHSLSQLQVMQFTCPPKWLTSFLFVDFRLIHCFNICVGLAHKRCISLSLDMKKDPRFNFNNFHFIC